MPSKKLDIKLAEKISAEGEKKIVDSYVNSLSDIRKEIERIYSKYSTAGVLKWSDMTRSDGQLLARYQEMYKNIFGIIKSNYKDVAGAIDKTFADTYKEGYYYRSYDIQSQLGKQLSFSMVQEKVINQAAMNPISGLTLNEIQDKDKARVIDQVNQSITRGLIQGASINEMDVMVKEALGIASNNSERIARTEALRAYSLGNLQSENEAKDMGIKLTSVWSTDMDGRERPSHEAMDGIEADEDGIFTLVSGDNKGAQAPEPRMFGIAAEDIQCRCDKVVQVAELQDDSIINGTEDFNYQSYDEYKSDIEYSE